MNAPGAQEFSRALSNSREKHRHSKEPRQPLTVHRYRYGIIGTGRPHGSEGSTGFGMAHPHYQGFKATDRTDLVAIADVREDNATLFLERYGERARSYRDYREMLANEKLDIVSVTVWPHLHAEMVQAAAEAGVHAIYCEKPMATTWGDAKRMKAAADAHGAILALNHQRRFLEPFQEAKRLLSAGEIGTPQLMEAQCGDMSDWGTHWLDMLFFLNDQSPAAWVIGQIDSRSERRAFGAFAEEQAVCHFKWQNEVRGLLITGFESKIGCAIRVIGSDGILEIGWGPLPLRVLGRGDHEWREVPVKERIHGDVAISRACADLVRALDEPGHKPLLSADNAIMSTEVIFGTYESAKRRGRVDLPLDYDGSALLDMLENHQIGPNAVKES